MPDMRWSEVSDAALLSATRSHGDAFAAFYDRYATPVIGYMLRRTGNVELAVDLASEVFATALAAAHRYQPTGATAAAWLFTIAQNTLTDRLRRRRVEARARRRLGIRDAIEYSTDELERIEAIAGQSDGATQLLQALPGDQREAIRARIIDERSYQEIARDMQTSELLLLSAYVDNGINRGVILVPEGVAKVTLDHFGLTAPTAARLDQLPQTTAAVSDNVARFQLAGLTEEGLHLNARALRRYFYQGSGRGCQISFAIYALPAIAQMTWFNAAGSAIRTTTVTLEFYVDTHHPAPGTTTQGPACAH